MLYKFNADLELTDSARIIGHKLCAPAFDDEGNMYTIGHDLPNGYDAIIKISPSLKELGRRPIDEVTPFLQEFRYLAQITRLKNKTFVIAYTDNRELPQENKIVMVGLNDPLNDDNPKWISNPATYNDEWIEELKPTEDGGIMVTGYDHTNVNYMFISKYNSEGIRYWKRSFALEGPIHQASEINGKFIYITKSLFYRLNQDGNTELFRFHDNELKQSPVSAFIGNEGFIYCGKDFTNPDGYFVKLYKMDYDFVPLDSALYGNRGTNLNNNTEFDRRWLIKLKNGEMVSINLVEKPGLNGNNWLFIRFDPDLLLIE